MTGRIAMGEGLGAVGGWLLVDNDLSVSSWSFASRSVSVLADDLSLDLCDGLYTPGRSSLVPQVVPSVLPPVVACIVVWAVPPVIAGGVT